MSRVNIITCSQHPTRIQTERQVGVDIFQKRIINLTVSTALTGSPGGTVVKNPPPNAGDSVWSLGREDPLELEMATHSSIFLPEKSHQQRSLAGYSPWGRKESDTTEHVHMYAQPENQWKFHSLEDINNWQCD